MLIKAQTEWMLSLTLKHILVFTFKTRSWSNNWRLSNPIMISKIKLKLMTTSIKKLTNCSASHCSISHSNNCLWIKRRSNPPQLSTLMFMENRNPLIFPSSDLGGHLSFPRTSSSLKKKKKTLPRISDRPSPYSDSSRHHFARSPSPVQRKQFRLLPHTVMACWPRQMESFQVLGSNLPPSLPPPLPPLPLHVSSSRLVQQRVRQALLLPE